jgi:hypothetical protein
MIRIGSETIAALITAVVREGGNMKDWQPTSYPYTDPGGWLAVLLVELVNLCGSCQPLRDMRISRLRRVLASQELRFVRKKR